MKKSENATIDGKCVEALRNKLSTQREKDAAFSTLYKRHKNAIFYKFIKGGVDKETAEDLISKTFEKIHTRLSKYDESQAVFSTWLYKIATNNLIDFKRKGLVEEFSLDRLSDKTSEDNDGMTFEIKSDILNPEEAIVRKEINNRVHNAVHAIENTFIRDVMINRYLNELPFKEVAKAMNVNDDSTLRVSVIRGKKLLKKQLSL